MLQIETGVGKADANDGSVRPLLDDLGLASAQPLVQAQSARPEQAILPARLDMPANASRFNFVKAGQESAHAARLPSPKPPSSSSQRDAPARTLKFVS